MATLISTKVLSEAQHELILNAGVSLVEYDAIKIEFIDFNIPEGIENAIFTSQNAVSAISKRHIEKSQNVEIQNCYCVGQKTKQALKDLNFNGVEVAENASALGKAIIEKHSEKEFVFFCGNMRRDELPDILKTNSIKLKEIEVYKTTLNKKTFDRAFDAVLCFSPSGVKSYFEANEVSTLAGITICIGPTTVSEAENYTNKIAIANRTSIESVITKAVKLLTKK